jgi:chromosome segregation ATPase
VSETQTGGVSEDPGRIIYEHEERLKAANAEIDRLRIELQETYAGWSGSNSALADQATEIDRLQAEWRAEFNAAQQLRSEVAQLERLLDDARDNLRVLEADGTAMDHHCEGMKAAYLAVIKTLTGGRA